MRKVKWEYSYTKRVVGELAKVRESISHFDPDYFKVEAAMNLLRDYWKDSHVPYEQRDGARKVVKIQTERLQQQDEELVRLRSKIANFGRIRFTYNGTTESPKQNYMACGHYPNAISNHFEGRTSCEFCCEKEPLKWFDNGHHRMPGT